MLDYLSSGDCLKFEVVVTKLIFLVNPLGKFSPLQLYFPAYLALKRVLKAFSTHTHTYTQRDTHTHTRIYLRYRYVYLYLLYIHLHIFI